MGPNPKTNPNPNPNANPNRKGNFPGEQLSRYLFDIDIFEWKCAFMTSKLQQQSFVDVLQNRRSLKFCKFHKKAYVLQSLFSKAAGLKAAILLLKRDSKTGAFLWNLRNFQEHLFSENTSGGCFWNYNDMKLVKSGTSETYHLCSSKKAICSRNIMTSGASNGK